MNFGEYGGFVDPFDSGESGDLDDSGDSGTTYQYGEFGNCVYSWDSGGWVVILVNLLILGESGNFGEYVVSCKSSESGNLNVFGDYDECGNFCECCYFG